MKKWLSKLFGKILAVGENRYVHSTIGALIASIMCCALCWIPLWACVTASMVVVIALAIVKEYAIDAQADVVDIVFTVAGAVVVLLPVIIIDIWTLQLL